MNHIFLKEIVVIFCVKTNEKLSATNPLQSLREEGGGGTHEDNTRGTFIVY